ncbi:MAG: M16 family metallopeptidase [Bacteroidota bacterium]
MRTKHILGTLVLALFVAGAAIAQKQTPPEGSTPKDFTLPAKSTFTLDNGLTVVLVQYGTLPKAAIRAVVNTGNVHEAPNEVWLADIMGDLMKEGTTTRNAKQIAKDAAKLGGSVSIAVGPDQTNIDGDVLSEFGPEMVALIADILCNPSFPESELARLKNDRMRQLSIEKTDPNSIALEKFRTLMYGDHPYGRLYPTETMLESYTIQYVRGFYESNFGAARTHVYVAGKFDATKMEDAIRKAFGAWKHGPEPAANIPKPLSKKEIHLIDRPGAPQSTVYIGLPTINPSDPDYRALTVTNALLGGSFGSRITSNIREDKGYTYSPNSSISSRYRDAYWVQFASVTTDVTGPSLKEIFFEIDRLQKEAPTAEELKGIQNYLAGVFVLQNSSAAGIINQLSFLQLHGLPDSYLTDYVKTIYSVTPEQVRDLTAKYIRDEEMLIVIAGDKKKIQKQVAPYGKVIG